MINTMAFKNDVDVFVVQSVVIKEYVSCRAISLLFASKFCQENFYLPSSYMDYRRFRTYSRSGSVG